MIALGFATTFLTQPEEAGKSCVAQEPPCLGSSDKPTAIAQTSPQCVRAAGLEVGRNSSADGWSDRQCRAAGGRAAGTAGEGRGGGRCLYRKKRGDNFFFFSLEIQLSALFREGNGKREGAGKGSSAAPGGGAPRGAERCGCGQRSGTLGGGRLPATPGSAHGSGSCTPRPGSPGPPPYAEGVSGRDLKKHGEGDSP